MRYDGLALYATWFESISALFGTWWVYAVVVIATLSPLVGLYKTRSCRSVLPLAMLGLGASLLVLGCYSFERNSFSSVLLLFAGAAVLFGYACVYGIRKPMLSPERSHADLIAASLIVLVTVVKCIQLEDWPPLLTDYAAMTGTSALQQYLPDSVMPVKPSFSGYLDRGGPSPIHAPLLQGLFQLYGYSSFAVRAAEVVGSTATLIVLWLWLRMSVSNGFGLMALGLFAFSSEHLSQSRMGTIFSISQALTLCTLWLWTSVRQGLSQKRWHAVGLFVSCALISYCYFPARAAWVFCAGMLLASVVGRYISRAKGVLVYYVIGVVALGAYVTLYLFGPLLNLSFVPPELVTDAPVWLKSADGLLSQFTQPPWTVLVNIFDNMKRIVTEPVSILMRVETIYVVFGSILLPLSVIGLWSPRWRFISAFVLCGLLPSIVTFPIARRSLMSRPFSIMLLALFVYEYVRVLRATIPVRLSGAAVASVLFLVGALPLQGVYLLARFNGPMGVGPSFGPEYAYDLIQHLKVLSKDHSIVVMNPGRGVVKYEMAFAKEIYIDTSRHHSVTVCTVAPTDTESVLPKTASPSVYAVLNEDGRAWVVPWLQSQVPGIDLRPYGRDGRTLYWLGTVKNSTR